MKKILVTGGAGFIGSHIVEALLKQGIFVRILDNFSTGKSKNLEALKKINKKQYEIVEGDIRDTMIVNQAMRDIEVVFHEAALVSVPESMKKPKKYFDVNVDGTCIVFQAAQNTGVRRVVFASSAAVYGNHKSFPLEEKLPNQPLSPYAVAKCVNEMYGQLYNQFFGVEIVALRYFNVYGPRQFNSHYPAVLPGFIHSLRLQEPVQLFGDGHQTRDMIFVGDVVKANILAAEHPAAAGEIFNICTGTETSMLDFFNELKYFFPHALEPKFSNYRPGDMYRSIGCPTKAEKIISFKAQTSLVEGIKKTMKYYSLPEKSDDF